MSSARSTQDIQRRTARLLRSVRGACLLCATLHAAAHTQSPDRPPMVAPNAELIELSNGHGFVEGPAVNREGTLFFTDLATGLLTRCATAR